MASITEQPKKDIFSTNDAPAKKTARKKRSADASSSSAPVKKRRSASAKTKKDALDENASADTPQTEGAGDEDAFLSTEYTKMDPIEHVLLRPDTYIGSNETTRCAQFLARDASRISFEPSVPLNTALTRIFVEVLSNAVDNVYRTREEACEAAGAADTIDSASAVGEPGKENDGDLTRKKLRANVRCTHITISVDATTGATSIANDGLWIPIDKGAEGVYNHTLVFGHLLTSSNYDDTRTRVTSGRNGLGAKLTNIYSTSFAVSGGDPERGLLFEQAWSRNMRDTTGPRVRTRRARGGFTRVDWVPDFARFRGSEGGYTDDTIAVMRKLAIDAAMLTGVRVEFNKERISVPGLVPYCKMYFTGKTLFSVPSTSDAEHQNASAGDAVMTEHPHFFVGEDDQKSDGPAGDAVGKKASFTHCVGRDDRGGISVVVVPADIPIAEKSNPAHTGRPSFVSFVNGIHTPAGGRHVDAWTSALCEAVAQRVSTKKRTILARDVKKCIFLIVSATVPNPAFESQNKQKLVSPAVHARVTPAMVAAVAAWPVVRAKLASVVAADDEGALRDISRGAKRKIVPGHIRANHAGGRRASECTLIVCEGKSAAGTAVIGMQVGIDGKKGHDFFGLYAARGKVMNARRASARALAKNREVQDIINSLGAKVGVDYSVDANFKRLNYGRLLVMADADTDGLHIVGLILNLFHKLFPSLLQRTPSFVVSLQTPIVRVSRPPARGGDRTFYDEDAFRRYAAVEVAAGRPVKKKYFKGLGTLTKPDVQECFGKKLVSFTTDADAEKTMNVVFGSGKADERKKWIAARVDPTTAGDDAESLDAPGSGARVVMKLSRFLDTQVIKFSVVDCMRSLPSCVDGFKTSQRKVLFTVLRRGLRAGSASLKVAQLAGATAELTNYPHGEVNLFDTITKMAASFVGSNNMPVLLGIGNFGSRLDGGADAANGRYTSTRLSHAASTVFLDEDMPVLDYVEDDGDRVEPVFFAPVIPMILVNGCNAGIGTGWSCSVPNYSPADVVAAVRRWIDATEARVDFVCPELTPWYAGHRGKMSRTTAAAARGIAEAVEHADEPVERDNGDPEEHNVDPKGENNNENEKNNENEDEDANDDKSTAASARSGGGETVFLSHTLAAETRPGVIEVTELPVGVWTNRYGADLEKLVEAKRIRSVVKKGDEETVRFIVTLFARGDGEVEVNEDDGNGENEENPKSGDKESPARRATEKKRAEIERIIRPVRVIRESNMVLFDGDGKIRKFDTPAQIVAEFCRVRLSVYEKRRIHILEKLTGDLCRAEMRKRFVAAVVSGELTLRDRPEADVVAEMTFSKYADLDADGFKYLLDMKMRECTLDKTADLATRIKKLSAEIDATRAKSARDVWRADLERVAFK